MATDIMRVVDAALEGQGPAVGELALICATDPFSKDAYYIRWGARELQQRASGGRGEVFSQIGIDAYPCDGGCSFCSFSSTNGSWTDELELDWNVAVGYARELAWMGLHMLSLMTPCSYDFGRFLELAARVREAVGPELSIMANIDDFAAVNEVYAEFFTQPYPARSAFAVAALPKGANIEIEAIAVK